MPANLNYILRNSQNIAFFILRKNVMEPQLCGVARMITSSFWPFSMYSPFFCSFEVQQADSRALFNSGWLNFHCSELSFQLHRTYKLSAAHIPRLYPSSLFLFGQGPLWDYSQVVSRTWTPSMTTAATNSVFPRLASSHATGFEKPSVIVGYLVIGR